MTGIQFLDMKPERFTKDLPQIYPRCQVFSFRTRHASVRGHRLLHPGSYDVRSGSPYRVGVAIRFFCLDMIFRFIWCAIRLSNWWSVGVWRCRPAAKRHANYETLFFGDNQTYDSVARCQSKRTKNVTCVHKHQDIWYIIHDSNSTLAHTNV